MCADIVIGCSQTAPGTTRLSLLEPLPFDAPAPGSLQPPPAAWQNAKRLFGSVPALSSWVHQSVGQPLLDAIAAIATEKDESSRLFVYSAPAARTEAHAVPWELLEHWPIERPVERLTVVRLLETDGSAAPPRAIGEKLRILALWADPDGNIADLAEHRKELETFAAKRPYSIALKVLELTDPETLIQAAKGFNPDAIYHVSHGEQPAPGSPVTLRVGAKGKPIPIDATAYLKMLSAIGAPRLVVLNACDTFSGAQNNVYFGAALAIVQTVDAVVSMQTQVPAHAAMLFAQCFLESLADGEGLVKSVAGGRFAMASGRGTAGLPVLTRFIPVLFQRTRQNALFSVDLQSRSRTRLLAKLAYHVEQVEPLLPRDAGQRIAQLLAGAEHNVSVVRGPQWVGKSTTVRAVVSSLLGEAVHAGKRHLYYSAASDEWIDDPKARVRQLLLSVADSFDWITLELKTSLARDESRDPEEAIAVLAAWLDEQAAADLRFVIVLDDLPSDLASRLAEIASRVVRSGHLMLVARDVSVAPERPVAIVEMGALTTAELAAALPDAPADEVQRLIERSNGMPFFVAAERRAPSVESAARIAAYVQARTRSLSAKARSALQRCALVQEPIPREVFASWKLDAVVEPLVADLLLMKTGRDALAIPDAIRGEVIRRMRGSRESAQREELLNAFADLAYAAKMRTFDRPRVVANYAEALRQAVALAAFFDEDPEAREQVLAAAKGIAMELHEQLMERDDQPEAAKAFWDSYRRAAMPAGLDVDREVEARYAACLQRLSLIERADEWLEVATEGDHRDDLQIRALLLHADVVKDLGRKDAWSRRIGILERARSVADALAQQGAPASLVKEHIATIEHDLGNALGYGRHADPPRAVEHLRAAVAIFDELGDIRAYRTRSEIVEIERYNERLTSEGRQKALEEVRARAEELAALGETYDAILHLYELGRLEDSPEAKAEWFRLAFERAGTAYAPLKWHAAIRWRMHQVEANQARFDEVKEEIEAYCRKLGKWLERAWSRRVLREAFRFLAEHYGAAGDDERRQRALLDCWSVIRRIHEVGEGRRDRAERIAVAREIGDPLDELMRSSLQEEQ